MSKWGGRSATRTLALVLRTYGPVCHLYAHGMCLVGTPVIRLDLPPRHPDGPSTDHLDPRSLPGSSELLDRLRPAHLRCNAGRGNRPLPSTTRTIVDGSSFFKA